MYEIGKFLGGIIGLMLMVSGIGWIIDRIKQSFNSPRRPSLFEERGRYSRQSQYDELSRKVDWLIANTAQTRREPPVEVHPYYYPE